MEIGDVVRKTFVLVPAEWSAARGLQTIQALGPTHVIVQRSDIEPERYYLYAVHEALALLRTADAAGSVRQALSLHQDNAVERISAHTRADEAPERCVIFDDDRLIGFYDAAARRGSVRRGAGDEASAAPSEQPSLVAEMPDRVGLHETVSLLVWLAATAPAGAAALALDLPAGSPVQVVVQARRGFAIVGRSECTLTVPAVDETLPCQFTVRATELGPGQVRVFAILDGQTLGVVALHAQVTETGAVDIALSSSRERVLDRVEVGRPDLSLLIWERTENGRTFLDLRLDAADPALGLNLKQFAPVSLRADPFQYFRAFFRDIEQFPQGDARSQQVATRRLASKGVELFQDLFPTDVQELLWSLRSRIASVQVQSDEPWIPWELCRLCGRDDAGRVVEGPFLSEAYAVTRWRPGLPQQPILTLDNMALVVPEDSQLPYAPKERDYLLSLNGAERKVSRVRAGEVEVLQALASGSYDAWHFSGHGCASTPDATGFAMRLERGESLTPTLLRGEPQNLGRTHPLVFLNACLLGQSAMSLTCIGGWADEFLNAGAGAFVGAYWSVEDATAFEFAQALYERLITGVPIGSAVQEARTAIRSNGSSTWLAYLLFAAPHAVVRSACTVDR